MVWHGGTACGVPPYGDRSRVTRAVTVAPEPTRKGACHPKRVALRSSSSSVIQYARRCTVAPLLRDEIPLLDPGNPSPPALDPLPSTRRDRGPGPSPPLVPRRLRDRSRATELDPPRRPRRSRIPNGAPWSLSAARRRISRFVHSAFPGKPMLTRAIDDRWTQRRMKT